MRKYILGIDLGGSQLRLILAHAETGDIFIPHNKNSKKSFISPFCGEWESDSNSSSAKISESSIAGLFIKEKIIEYLGSIQIAPSNITGVGVSVAGKILPDGRFMGSNIPLKFATIRKGLYGVELIKYLRGILPKPIKINIENDANCAGLAQAYYYDYKGINPLSTFYITVSTGIGGGGPRRDLDEVGHMIIDDCIPQLSMVCGCGAIGCIETSASGEGIKNRTLRMLELYLNQKQIFNDIKHIVFFQSKGKYDLSELIENSILLKLFKEKHKIDAKIIFDYANLDKKNKLTDYFAVYLVETLAGKLAKLLINLTRIHDIERFGIGGGVAANNIKLLELVKEKMSKYFIPSDHGYGKNIIVEPTPIRDYINDYGALFLAVDKKNRISWIKTIIEMEKKNIK